jgi:hypothetical protein
VETPHIVELVRLGIAHHTHVATDARERRFRTRGA